MAQQHHYISNQFGFSKYLSPAPTLGCMKEPMTALTMGNFRCCVRLYHIWKCCVCQDFFTVLIYIFFQAFFNNGLFYWVLFALTKIRNIARWNNAAKIYLNWNIEICSQYSVLDTSLGSALQLDMMGGTIELILSVHICRLNLLISEKDR